MGLLLLLFLVFYNSKLSGSRFDAIALFNGELMAEIKKLKNHHEFN